MARGELLALGERGEDERGRGHRQTEARNEGRFPGEAERQREAGKHRAGREHLRAAEAEYRPAQYPQAAGLQLEAHEEKQEHHAELGELQSGFDLPDHAEAEGADQHAGAEIAEHRAELQALEERHEQHRGEEKNGSLFEEVHGAIRGTGMRRIMRERRRARNGTLEKPLCPILQAFLPRPSAC